MKIIGHRGAAGSELENTLASLQVAKDLGVDAIEFDVRKTGDGKLVVFHDTDLRRVSDSTKRIDELTLKQIQKIPVFSGSHIPTLAEALDVLGDSECIIEIKDHGCAEELVRVLRQHTKANFIVASFKLDELSAVRALAPEIKLYALERTNPIDIIHEAKDRGFDGIGFNYWILNPLNYWLCKRAGLEIYAYTVDNRFQAKFLNWFYPDVGICTNYPERFIQPAAPKVS